MEIPGSLNLTLAALLGVVNLGMLAAVPLLARQDTAWGLALVPAALATPALWALLHEAFHGTLHADRRVNTACGRVLAVLFGSPFALLRFGHLMHHRFNRTALDRAEVVGDDRAGRIATWLAYYIRLLGGLYLAEFLASAAALLPRPMVAATARFAFSGEEEGGPSLQAAAERRLLTPAMLAELRLDGFAVVLVYGGAFLLYGPLWWMLALAILARAFLVSFFDNAHHYGTALDDVLNSYNLHLPRPLAAAMLNFNLHAEHHRQPDLPWTALPAAFAETGGSFEGGYFGVALRQLAGPLPKSRLQPRGAGYPLDPGLRPS